MTMIKGDKLPSLTSERLVLRWLEPSDVESLFKIFSDKVVMRYWSSPPWSSMADAVEMVDSVRRYFAKGSLYQWGVTRRSDDVVIGTCTLAEVDEQNRRAEIGFALRQDHWGQGYMSEALQALLTFSFDELKLHRLEADVDPRNEASIRLLEKLGFQREGYLRERWIVGDEICDTVFYGLLRSEWGVTAGIQLIEAKFKGKSLVVKLAVDSTKIQRITDAFVHPHSDAYRMHLLTSEGPASGTTTFFGNTWRQTQQRMLYHTIEFSQRDAVSSEEKKMINSLEVIGTRPDGGDCRYVVDLSSKR